MELQIIRAQEFIRLGAHGRLDLKASKALLAVLADACWKRGINQALLDLRALHPGPKPVFSGNDLVMLVSTFREIGFTHRERLAVLYRSDPHRRASMFASIAKLRGWSVQAFDNFEEAVVWLSAAENEPSAADAEITPRAKKVPMRNLRKVKPWSKPACQPTVQIKTTTSPRTGKKPTASVRATLAMVAIAFISVLARQIAEAQPVTNASAVTNLAASAFGPTVPNKIPPPGPAPEGMVWIPGGEFSMGCEVPSEGVCTMATMNSVHDAQPIHRVYVDGFWMDTERCDQREV